MDASDAKKPGGNAPCPTLLGDGRRRDRRAIAVAWREGAWRLRPAVTPECKEVVDRSRARAARRWR